MLYVNIFIGKRFRTIAQIVLGLVFSWTVSFFFANLFTCYPITPFIEAFYGNHCVDGLSLWYAMAISDIVIDIIILFLPIPMVLRLQLPLKQRLGVLGMFLLGATYDREYPHSDEANLYQCLRFQRYSSHDVCSCRRETPASLQRRDL